MPDYKPIKIDQISKNDPLLWGFATLIDVLNVNARKETYLLLLS